MHTKEDIIINTLEGMAADAEDAGKESVLVNLSYDDIKMINAALNVASGNAKECSCKPYNELEATVPLMLHDDYRARFVAEYSQTKIRYERLKRFNTKIEAARRQRSGNPMDWTGMVSQILGAKSVTENDNKWVTEPKHDCPEELLREQQRVMGEYLHILEVRAVIEGIEL